MAHYVIGDVQGCFEELLDLTKLIEFSSINDRLIFAGDLVNRGPQSLEVLDFLGQNYVVQPELRSEHKILVKLQDLAP